MAELRLLAAGVARVVPSLCGVLLTVTAAGVDSTIRLAVNGDGSEPVRSSLQLPLSGGTSGGVVVFQASTLRAFDELGRDAVVLLPDGGLGVELDRHLSRTTAAPSAGYGATAGSADPAGDLALALSDASLVNQALGVLLGQGFVPVDASTELDRRAGEAGQSRVAAATEVLEAVTGGRREREGRRAAIAPQGAHPDPS